MKKIILAAIILAAAGGALYYFTQNKKTVEPVQSTYKQTILGNWKIDSIQSKNTNKNIGFLSLAADSNFMKYQFRFKEDGSIVQSLGDSILPIKHGYEWKDSSSLVLLEGDSLTEKTSVQVLALNENELTITTADSTTVFYKKVNK